MIASHSEGKFRLDTEKTFHSENG